MSIAWNCCRRWNNHYNSLYLETEHFTKSKDKIYVQDEEEANENVHTRMLNMHMHGGDFNKRAAANAMIVWQ